MVDQLVPELLLEVDALAAGLRQTINGIHHQVKTVQVIEHGHIERSGDGALFLVAADVQIVVIGAPVSQAVNQPRVGMKGKDDRLVPGEKLVEFPVAQSVRMLGLRLQTHEVDDVHHPDSQLRQVLAHDRDGGKRL